MKKYFFYLVFLLVGLHCFGQASSNMNIDIALTLDADDLKDSEFFFIGPGAVSFPECTYTVEPASDKAIIRIRGKYHYVIGPDNFLGSLLIAKSAVNDSGTETIENYFIHIDKDHTRGLKSLGLDLGEIQLGTYNYITVNCNHGKAITAYDAFPHKHQDYLTEHMQRLTKIKAAKS